MLNRFLMVLSGLLIALGALWAGQGAGIIHAKPILCFADCTELQGASGEWLAIGLGAIAVGAGVWFYAKRRSRNATSRPG